MLGKAAGRKIFHRLATIEDAKEILSKSASNEIGMETVRLEDAGGRVLAESVFSGVDLPPFDRAEMDGFAVVSEDLEGASERKPVRLKVSGSIGAGEPVHREIRRGECAEIATGAPVPRGADSVVMVEYTGRAGEYVKIFRGTTPGENVASAGSDIQVGEMILRGGTVLGTREIGILAAAGKRNVRVGRKPRVGIISTGDELVDVGERLSFGKIYDVNSSSLRAAVEEAGGEALYLGRTKDDYENVKKIIAEGIERCDILIISGGTSAGTGDLVYRVLEEACKPGILVHGLQVKPGKPTIIAADKGKPIFGLPGYPVSALIIFDQIVRPYLERLGRRPPSARGVLRGRLAERVNGARGRRWFLPVHVIRREERNSVYPVLSSSGAIGTLAKADGYIVVGEDVEFLDSGKEVVVNLFLDQVTSADLTVMGSHCPGLDLLLELLFRREGIRSKTANIGSLGGLGAVARGEADIAGIHLLDEESLKYNEPYVIKAGLPKGSFVKGYRRLQGIMVKKGTPKRVRNLKDVLLGDTILVNRNRGSGTRILTDHILKAVARERGLDLAELVKGIKGYRWEAKTHSAVAAAVHQGRADAGVGVKSVARAYGLGFIPIGYEEYDFVVNPESRNKDGVKAFLRYLRSEDFKGLLGRLPGYTV
ncbi:MAG: molybdopterin biosynthesis protein [Candidatus Verstraetearchaeota archaeon]|nr:molybdopterin biosynthesis protein [Candidatus Verstraetearchaeota archaeon]